MRVGSFASRCRMKYLMPVYRQLLSDCMFILGKWRAREVVAQRHVTRSPKCAALVPALSRTREGNLKDMALFVVLKLSHIAADKPTR